MRKMVSYKGIAIIIISLMIIPLFSTSPQAEKSTNKSNSNILYVSKTGSTYSRIQDALDNVTDGETIIIGNGTYNEKWNITKSNLNIIGNSSRNVIIDMSNQLFSINICGLNNTINNINFTYFNESLKEMMIISNNNNSILNCDFFSCSNNINLINITNTYNTIINNCNVFMNANFSISYYIYQSYNCNINNSSFYAEGKNSSCINIFNSENIVINNCFFKTDFTYKFPRDHNAPKENWWLCGIMFNKCRLLTIKNNLFNLSGGGGDPDRRVYSIGIVSYPFHPYLNWEYSIHSHNVIMDKLSFIHNPLGDSSIDIFGVSHIKIRNNNNAQFSSLRISIRSSIDIEINNSIISILKLHGVYNANITNNTIFRLTIWSTYVNTKLKFSDDILIYNNTILNLDGNIGYPVYIEAKDVKILNNTLISVRDGLRIDGINIDIKWNLLDFVGEGMYIRSENRDNEQKRLMSNINITNNRVHGTGNHSCVKGIILSSISGALVNDNEIVIGGNKTYQNRGIWMEHVDYTGVERNHIHTSSTAATGILIGERVVGAQTWKKNFENNIEDNLIISENERSVCLEVTNISFNNTFRGNTLLLKNGTDMNFLKAANTVEGKFYFKDATRDNSTGNDVVLTRGYPLYPDEGSYYGPNISVYNLEVKRADIMERCKLDVWQKYEAISYDSMNRIMPDMDYSIYNDGRYYNTTGYNGTYEIGKDDVFGPFWVRDAYYQGNYPTIEYDTTIKAKYLMDTLWEEERTDNIGKSTREVFQVPDFYKPLVPSGLQAEALPNSQNVKVSWDPVLNHLTHYVMEADLGDGWEVLIKPDRNETEFLHEDLVQDLVIKYRITGSNRGLNSDFTSPVQVTVGDITPPSPPEDIEVLYVNMTTISIKWKVPVDEDVINVKAEVRRSGSDDIIETKDLQRNENFTQFNDLEQNTEYIVKVTFFDDADHLSFDSISARTSVLTGIIHIQVWFEEGSPDGGYGQFVNVELIGSNFTQPKGRTDQLGRLRLINIHLPDTIRIELIPSYEMIGIMGEKSGYIPMESDPIRINPDNHELTIELIMEYYELDPGAPTGMIEGIVSYPLSGPRFGSVSHSNVTLLSVNGSVYSRTRTDSLGYFVFNGVKLKRYFKVQADPLKEDGDRYHSTISDLIYLNESVMRKQIGLILGYYQGDIEQTVIDILEYGPVGMDIDHSHVIYIRFSHEITTEQLEGMMKLDPQPSDPDIYLSEDKKTLFLRHEGLQSSTRYNVSVSIMLEFKDALGLNKTFKWSFWTEEQINDPHENDGEEKGINWWIPVVLVILILLGISFLIFLRRMTMEEEVVGDYPGDEQ